jgi:hypothetical protein
MPPKSMIIEERATKASQAMDEGAAERSILSGALTKQRVYDLGLAV